MNAVDEGALAFFNRLSGKLDIELTEPAQRAAPNMLNLAAPPTARIRSVSFHLYISHRGDERELTDDERKTVVLRAPAIRMRSVDTPDVVIDHAAPDGATFSVRDLADAIARTERESREHGEWLGGIDVHHVFFEGIEFEDDAWTICWGS